MSVSYAVDFAALLLLGADETMLVAGNQRVEPVHVPDADPARPSGRLQHGVPGPDGEGGRLGVHRARRTAARHAATRSSTIPKPLVGAATAYFICNTLLDRDGDRPVDRQSIHARLERELPVERAELLLRRRRRGLAAAVVERGGYWMALLAAAPLYLIYRTYKVYLGRIQDQQRHVQQVSDLHLATIEALALAIDAKDQTAQSHIRRVQVYAAGLARALGMPETEIQGVKTAALLHDIGKLAVPEHILSKPGRSRRRSSRRSASIRRSAPRSSAACRSRIRWRR